MNNRGAIYCCFCDWPLEFPTKIVQIECGEVTATGRFSVGLFPDGESEKFAHMACVDERFTAVDPPREHCPYCRRPMYGRAALSFQGGMFDGAISWVGRPILVCARCSIETIGDGDNMNEVQRVLGWTSPDHFAG